MITTLPRINVGATPLNLASGNQWPNYQVKYAVIYNHTAFNVIVNTASQTKVIGAQNADYVLVGGNNVTITGQLNLSPAASLPLSNIVLGTVDVSLYDDAEPAPTGFPYPLPTVAIQDLGIIAKDFISSNLIVPVGPGSLVTVNASAGATYTLNGIHENGAIGWPYAGQVSGTQTVQIFDDTFLQIQQITGTNAMTLNVLQSPNPPDYGIFMYPTGQPSQNLSGIIRANARIKSVAFELATYTTNVALRLNINYPVFAVSAPSWSVPLSAAPVPATAANPFFLIGSAEPGAALVNRLDQGNLGFVTAPLPDLFVPGDTVLEISSTAPLGPNDYFSYGYILLSPS